ncbi:hypothetical protein [Streptomyces huasconensis]|uniref:hypothetical protein n=1 Tax=Streptomyces huasconensis TaxID=1854574 RepID=UPI0037014154
MSGGAVRRLSLGVRPHGGEEWKTGLPLPTAPPDPYDCPFHELLVMEPERGRLDALLAPQLLGAEPGACGDATTPVFEAATLAAGVADATDRPRSALTDSRADGFVVRLPGPEALARFAHESLPRLREDGLLPAAERGFRRLRERFPAAA